MDSTLQNNSEQFPFSMKSCQYQQTSRVKQSSASSQTSCHAHLPSSLRISSPNYRKATLNDLYVFVPFKLEESNPSISYLCIHMSCQLAAFIRSQFSEEDFKHQRCTGIKNCCYGPVVIKSTFRAKAVIQ